MRQRQRKALGWIVQEAVEKFVAERAVLRPREADDIEEDFESLLPLLSGDERHIIAAMLHGGFSQNDSEGLRAAA